MTKCIGHRLAETDRQTDRHQIAYFSMIVRQHCLVIIGGILAPIPRCTTCILRVDHRVWIGNTCRSDQVVQADYHLPCRSLVRGLGFYWRLNGNLQILATCFSIGLIIPILQTVPFGRILNMQSLGYHCVVFSARQHDTQLVSSSLHDRWKCRAAGYAAVFVPWEL